MWMGDSVKETMHLFSFFSEIKDTRKQRERREYAAIFSDTVILFACFYAFVLALQSVLCINSSADETH